MYSVLIFDKYCAVYNCILIYIVSVIISSLYYNSQLDFLSKVIKPLCFMVWIMLYTCLVNITFVTFHLVGLAELLSRLAIWSNALTLTPLAAPGTNNTQLQPHTMPRIIAASVSFIALICLFHGSSLFFSFQNDPEAFLSNGSHSFSHGPSEVLHQNQQL